MSFFYIFIYFQKCVPFVLSAFFLRLDFSTVSEEVRCFSSIPLELPRPRRHFSHLVT